MWIFSVCASEFPNFLLRDFVILAKQTPIRMCIPESLLLDLGYQSLFPFGPKSDFLPWFSSYGLLLIKDDEISIHFTWDKIASLEEWNSERFSLCSSK